MGIGAAVKLLVSLLFLLPGAVRTELPGLPKAEVALELAPALLGVGFLLGYRHAAVCMAGAVISALALTALIGWMGEGMSRPLYPDTKLLIGQMGADDIWSRYVRDIGAVAVATAGILSVLRGLPAMAGAFLAIARRFPKGRGADSPQGGEGQLPQRTNRDLPGGFVVGGIVFVVVVAALVPGVFAGEMSALQRVVCAAGVGVFGILFVAVAARIVGIVGVSSQPVSGMTLVTLLGVASVFAALSWTDPGARAAVLTVGTIVAVAASKAGDISQDLKTGYLVGATPAWQQFGQLIGASVACWAVAGAVLLLGSVYQFGSAEVPAPQATLMKTVIEGVLAGDLPWGLVLTGTGLSVGALLCGASGLAFAIGVYLPFAFPGSAAGGPCRDRGGTGRCPLALLLSLSCRPQNAGREKHHLARMSG